LSSPMRSTHIAIVLFSSRIPQSYQIYLRRALFWIFSKLSTNSSSVFSRGSLCSFLLQKTRSFVGFFPTGDGTHFAQHCYHLLSPAPVNTWKCRGTRNWTLLCRPSPAGQTLFFSSLRHMVLASNACCAQQSPRSPCTFWFHGLGPSFFPFCPGGLGQLSAETFLRYFSAIPTLPVKPL